MTDLEYAGTRLFYGLAVRVKRRHVKCVVPRVDTGHGLVDGVGTYTHPVFRDLSLRVLRGEAGHVREHERANRSNDQHESERLHNDNHAAEQGSGDRIGIALGWRLHVGDHSRYDADEECAY